MSDYTKQQEALIQLLADEGIDDQDVLSAIGRVPRHFFVDPAQQMQAYENTALPISDNQTISQPYMVALMTRALLEAGPLNRVLEIGTGSGYQTAILASLAKEVYTIERIKHLHDKAREHPNLADYNNIIFKLADGHEGWKEEAPFNGIIVAAATDRPPKSLIYQLADGGSLVIPVQPDPTQQILIKITRHADQYQTTVLDTVSFTLLEEGIQN